MKQALSKLRILATPEGWTGTYGLFLLTVFILWVPSDGYADIVLPKHRLFLWATGFFLLALAPMALWRWWKQAPGLRCTWSQRLPFCFAAGLLVLFYLSAVASAYPGTAWLGNRRNEGFLTLALYLAVFAAAACWAAPGALHAGGASVAALLVAALVLVQFLGYNPLGLYPQGLGFHDRGLRYSGEYLGTIGNSDLLSAYLTMACLFLWGAYAVSRRRIRFLYLLAGEAAWCALLLSEVAAGPVAVLGCLALCLPLCLAKGLGIRRMGEICALLALGGLGKSALGYRYHSGMVTWFFSWDRTSWLLLAAVLLGLTAAMVLRRLPEGVSQNRSGSDAGGAPGGSGGPGGALRLYRSAGTVTEPVAAAPWQSAAHPGLQPHCHLAGGPGYGVGDAATGRWTGYLSAPLPPDFHPRAARWPGAQNQCGRRPLRIFESVGEHGSAQYAPVSGAVGLCAPASGPASGRRDLAPAATCPGVCHTRPVWHQSKPGEPPLLFLPGGPGPGQPVHKITHLPRSGRIGLTGVIFMRKRDSVICFCAVALAVVLLLYALPSRAVETGSWGLSFQAQGQAPVGSASQEALAQYDAAYLGDTGQPVLYLTFDAGYENGCTAQILDVLKDHQVPAAFFLVGNYLERNPELVKRMVEEGHTVGNHTAHHYDMSKIGDKATFSQELKEVEDLYRDVTGQELPRYYRPPQGIYSQENLAMAQELGYKTVFWSLAYVDWNNDSQPTREEAFSKLIPRIHNGAVVLLHSTSKTNAAILDELLTKWEEMGYRFESVESLFA